MIATTPTAIETLVNYIRARGGELNPSIRCCLLAPAANQMKPKHGEFGETDPYSIHHAYGVSIIQPNLAFEIKRNRTHMSRVPLKVLLG